MNKRKNPNPVIFYYLLLGFTGCSYTSFSLSGGVILQTKFFILRWGSGVEFSEQVGEEVIKVSVSNNKTESDKVQLLLWIAEPPHQAPSKLQKTPREEDP